MKFGEYYELRCFVDGHCFDERLSTIFDDISIVKMEPLALPYPLLPELFRDSFDCLGRPLRVGDHNNFSFLLEMETQLSFLTFVEIQLVDSLDPSLVELLVKFQSVFDLLLQSVLLRFFDDFVCNKIFFHFLLLRL